jgi:hypothetical protein
LQHLRSRKQTDHAIDIGKSRGVETEEEH